VKLREISRARANILLSCVRRPEADFMAQELAWFETDDSRVIATLVTDADGEFSSIILARDGRERFRAVAVTDPAETTSTAAGILRLKLEELMPHIDTLRIQGDEVGKPVDFFRPRVREEKLHANYRRLATGDDFAAARSVINELMRWYEDVDGNFIEQFQTTGFDARVWELYLYAALVEDGLHVTRPAPAPDMLAGGLFGDFALEATTIQPSKPSGGQAVRPPVPQTRMDLEAYVRQYLPIRYAGPLSSKLRRRYWDFPSVNGKPLVLAIQDFHSPLSMVYSYPALPIYLYGFAQVPQRDSDGGLTVNAVRIPEHRWGAKVVPSGFFSLPGAEYISAVICNNSGTINKFNRIGVGAGFGSGRVTLVQSGMVGDPDPHSSEPLPFERVVAEGHPETWIEGMDVFHNPNAMHPLAEGLLRGAAHHRLLPDMQIETTGPSWKPLESRTEIRKLSS
jgi:hypothetical protein